MVNKVTPHLIVVWHNMFYRHQGHGFSRRWELCVCLCVCVLFMNERFLLNESLKWVNEPDR